MSDFEQLADLLRRHREAAPLASLMLPEDGVAVVAGAYKGDTLAFLRAIYGPELRLFGYEPQDWAAQELRDRFAGDDQVMVREFGLGDRNGSFPMHEFGNDAASFLALPESRQGGTGRLRDVRLALMEEGLDAVDLLVLNMEGYEYRLLRHLVGMNWLQRINYLLVQFHHAEKLPYPEMREMLGATHEVLWDNGPSWVLWRRRGAAP